MDLNGVASAFGDGGFTAARLFSQGVTYAYNDVIITPTSSISTPTPSTSRLASRGTSSSRSLASPLRWQLRQVPQNRRSPRLVDEMAQRDYVSFTTIIMGLAQNGFSAEALLLFSQMVGDGARPNEVTLATVLSSCVRLCHDLGKMVHGFAKKTGLDGFVLVGTNLVNWYGVSSELEESRKVFDETLERNTVT